jgi:hypothetical protein
MGRSQWGRGRGDLRRGGRPRVDGPARTDQLVRELRDDVRVVPMGDPAYWRREITDERYLAVSTR